MRQFAFYVCFSLLALPSYSINRGKPAHPVDCVADLEALSPDSTEWRRISVRDVAKPLLDEKYLIRSQLSVLRVFAPWFKQSVLARDPFSEMLKKQHALLVAGADGNEVYQGASRREPGVPTDYRVVPGVPLYESNPNGGSFAFAFRWDLHIGAYLTPGLRQQIQNYRDAFVGNPPQEPSERTVDTLGFESPVIELLEMPRLGRTVRVWNEIYANYIKHHYPSHADSKKMMEEMGRIIDSITLRIQGESIDRNLDVLVGELAEYIYLGAHAHLFNGANFSLVMSQANYILRACGLTGISHSNLDFFALAVSFHVFEERIRDEIASVNAMGSLQPAALLVHIANVGDRLFWPGEMMGEKDCRLEGVALSYPLGPRVKLKYKAHLQGTGETPWMELGAFAGTRGQSRPMEQITLTLEGAASLFSIHCIAKVEGIGLLPAVGSDEPCGVLGHALTGLQIEIIPNRVAE